MECPTLRSCERGMRRGEADKDVDVPLVFVVVMVGVEEAGREAGYRTCVIIKWVVVYSFIRRWCTYICTQLLLHFARGC